MTVLVIGVVWGWLVYRGCKWLADRDYDKRRAEWKRERS